jgi:hypothetical protein
MEWQTYEYHGLAGGGVSIGVMGYTGFIDGPNRNGRGFRSWTNIEDDYSGFFNVANIGGFINLGPLGTHEIGMVGFSGHPDSSIQGYAIYNSVSGTSIEIPININWGGNIVFYEPTSDIHPHYMLIEPKRPDGPKKVDLASLLANLFINPSVTTQDRARAMARQWSDIFNVINYDSWYESE